MKEKVKRIRWILIAWSVLLVGCQEPAPASKNPKNQHIVYYKNGSVKQQFTVDKANRLHGKYLEYDHAGKLLMKARFFHDKEVQAEFYKNGKLIQICSRIINSKYSEINSIVYFDSNGNIIDDKSNYAKIRYGDANQKSLIIELPNFHKDSINVFFYKSLWGFENMVYNNGSKQIHRVVHFDKMDKVTIKLDLHDDDYFNGKLNLLIRGYKGKHRYEDGIHFMPQIKDMFVQLSKGEEPAKYNIDPIFAW